ncbi:YdcF family protein [Aquabacterium sp.]|uniref:YdcF family protein n=1 Tax=Aquabacterium sp. TaxID=1872578 RepID=UPI0037836EF2
MVTLGLSDLKPMLTALLLPPVPLLVLVLAGARLLTSSRRREWGAMLLLSGVLLLWLSCCAAVGHALERGLLHPPPALSEARIQATRQDAAARGKAVVLILGGGRESLAPEYGEAHLSARSMQRLHYGLWLARRLNAPVMFSGGTGLAQAPGPAEADIAARVAERDYGRRLRWVENTSRDTRENASASLAMLADQGITELVLVTHGWHMPRAVRAFEEAAARRSQAIQIIPAPMGLAAPLDRPTLNWLPSHEGFAQVRLVVREVFGRLLGA